MVRTKSISEIRKEGFRILIVDDDELILTFLSMILKQPKYIVQTAINGKEGLEKAKDFNPDIIISDVVMPVMDGYKFCSEIRKNPQFATTIFLLSSATLMEVKDAIKGLKGGADDYLLKPLTKDTALAKIDAFLRIKLLQDDLLISNSKLIETVDLLREHEKQLNETITEKEKEKRLLKNSLREISFLMEELEKSTQHHIELNLNLEKNSDDLVKLLSAIIEIRHPNKSGHSQRIADISRFISNEFGLSQKNIRDIETAALLHEIGTIGMPDDILIKDPETYNANEQKIIAQQPLIGESLLKGYSGLENVALITRHIHESIDGSGYPDGLLGNSIPIGSQIIRIAILFDELDPKSNDIYGEVISIIESQGIEFEDSMLYNLKKYIESNITHPDNSDVEIINITGMKRGMTLAKDVYTSTGIKLIPKGTILSDSSINCILNYNKTDPLNSGISILKIDK